jgi:hypothetical protein
VVAVARQVFDFDVGVFESRSQEGLQIGCTYGHESSLAGPSDDFSPSGRGTDDDHERFGCMTLVFQCIGVVSMGRALEKIAHCVEGVDNGTFSENLGWRQVVGLRRPPVGGGPGGIWWDGTAKALRAGPSGSKHQRTRKLDSKGGNAAEQKPRC